MITDLATEILVGNRIIAGSGGSVPIDATGEYLGWVFPAPATGVLTGIYVYAAVVGTSGTYDFRLETIDPVTGLFTGTLAAANTNIATVVSAVGFHLATFTAGLNVTKGQLIGFVVRWSSGNVTFNTNIGTPAQMQPYTISATPTATKGSSCPALTVMYGSTAYTPFGCSSGRQVPYTMGTSSNPDEVGTKINLPFACRVSGLMVVYSPSAAGRTADIVLYDSAGVAQFTYAYDPDVCFATTGNNLSWIQLPTAFDVAANTNFFVTVKATSVGTVSLTAIDYPTAAIKQASPWGQFVTLVARQNLEDWAGKEVDTRIACAFPVLSGIDFGGAAASGAILSRILTGM